MKTVVLLATTTLLAAVVIMPVSAEPSNTVKQQGMHLFHAKKIAFKQESSDQAQAETTKPVKGSLDYSTDNFIIN